MRVRHLVAAAAASLAFATAPAPVGFALLLAVSGPAEAQRYVLVRQAPEFPNGEAKTTEKRESGEFDVESLEIGPGSVTCSRRMQWGGQEFQLEGSVAFDEPPERIELDENGRATLTLTATGTFSGETNCCHIGLSFHYASGAYSYGAMVERGSGRLGTHRFDSVGLKTNYRGHEQEFKSGSHSHTTTSEIGVSVASSQRREGQRFEPIRAVTDRSLYIVYPYVLVEEPDEPQVAARGESEVAAREVSNCLDYRRVIHDHHQAIQASSGEYAEMASYMAEYDSATRVTMCTEDYGRSTLRGVIKFDDSWAAWLANANTTVGYIGKIPAIGAITGRIGKGLGHLAQYVGMLEEERLPVDEAWALYKEIQAERRATIDMLTHGVGLYYCRQIFPYDKQLYRLYHEEIPNSDICSAADKRALLGDIVRNRPAGLAPIWLNHIFEANQELCSSPAAQRGAVPGTFP